MKSREYKYLRRRKIKLRSISFVDGLLKVNNPSYAYEFLSKHPRNISYGYQFAGASNVRSIFYKIKSSQIVEELGMQQSVNFKITSKHKS